MPLGQAEPALYRRMGFQDECNVAPAPVKPEIDAVLVGTQRDRHHVEVGERRVEAGQGRHW